MIIKKHEENGSILIITLLLISILIALVVNFVYAVFIDTSSMSNWSNAQRASFIARSGQNLSTEYIKEIRQYSFTYEREAAIPVEHDFGPDILLEINVEDLNAKFNINSIIYQRGGTNEEALSSLKKLFEYLKINSDLPLIIADWIDTDSEPRLSDSENSSKNTFLWCVDELKFIEGIDNNIFKAISPYITVYGNNTININTAELPVLVSLHSDMTEELAKRIIYYREGTPFEKTNDLQNLSGLGAIGIQLKGRITVKTSSFGITARATVNEITRIIESVVDSSMQVQFWREG